MEQQFFVSKGFYYEDIEVDGKPAIDEGFIFPEIEASNGGQVMTEAQIKEMLRDHITIGDFDSTKVRVVGNYEDTYCEISIMKNGSKIGELNVTEYFDTRQFESLFTIEDGEVEKHPALIESESSSKTEKALEVCQKVCEDHPEVKSVGLSEPYQDHIVILFDEPNEGLIKKLRGYFDYDHPKDLPDGGTQIPVIEGELSKALAKIGLEMGGGFDYVPNEEAAKADYSNWLKDNPRPVDPTSDSRWRSRSYYDRTKGSGAREYAKFKDDYTIWKEKYNNAKGGFAPQHLPGMYFSVQRLGQSDEIAAFYAGSNWWGD